MKCNAINCSSSLSSVLPEATKRTVLITALVISLFAAGILTCLFCHAGTAAIAALGTCGGLALLFALALECCKKNAPIPKGVPLSTTTSVSETSQTQLSPPYSAPHSPPSPPYAQPAPQHFPAPLPLGPPPPYEMPCYEAAPVPPAPPYAQPATPQKTSPTLLPRVKAGPIPDILYKPCPVSLQSFKWPIEDQVLRPAMYSEGRLVKEDAPFSLKDAVTKLSEKAKIGIIEALSYSVYYEKYQLDSAVIIFKALLPGVPLEALQKKCWANGIYPALNEVQRTPYGHALFLRGYSGHINNQPLLDLFPTVLKE